MRVRFSCQLGVNEFGVTNVYTGFKDMEWEDKVTASGCVDFDGTGRQGAGGGRNAKQSAAQQRSSGQSSSQGGQQQRGGTQQPQPQTTTHVQQVHYLGGPGSNIPLVQNLHTIPGTHLSQGAAAAQAVLPTGAIAFATTPNAGGNNATTVRMVAPHAGQYAIMQSAGGHPGMQQGIMLVSTTGQHIPHVVVTTANLVSMPVQTRVAPVKSEPGVHQLDGVGAPLVRDDVDNDSDDLPTSSHLQASANRTRYSAMPAAAQRQVPLKKKKNIVIQVDGPGGVSDSSSDEDIEEEEDDDPLRRIVDRIGEGVNGDDEDQSVEDDPLNSGDDQSDDEDIDTLFDADNVVMCQFEKVHRARARWKFTLKDGIMHIQGKDHVFQRATGEAEW
uniref:Uncharacterized protein n=1 Tax=Plectus sambesii TaxID=2011161 RepID=A0A914UQH3_9BILA